MTPYRFEDQVYIQCLATQTRQTKQLNCGLLWSDRHWDKGYCGTSTGVLALSGELRNGTKEKLRVFLVRCETASSTGGVELDDRQRNRVDHLRIERGPVKKGIVYPD
jgi:hypothetical protein